MSRSFLLCQENYVEITRKPTVVMLRSHKKYILSHDHEKITHQKIKVKK